MPGQPTGAPPATGGARRPRGPSTPPVRPSLHTSLTMAPARAEADGRLVRWRTPEVGVVVIEDDHHISDLVAMYLRRDGFRVVQADDAERGLAAIDREAPRLVVVDIGLPGELDGLDVCRRLAAAVPPVPVLILSARDDEVDRVLGLELGADDYVTKPFSARELVARVHAILRRTGRGRHGRRRPDGGRVRGRVRRHRAARGPPGRRGRAPGHPGVRPAGLPRGQPGPGALPPAAPRRGLGRGLVRRRAHRRRARPPTPQEARDPTCRSPPCGASATGSDDRGAAGHRPWERRADPGVAPGRRGRTR